jgi:hypothetical protein
MGAACHLRWVSAEGERAKNDQRPHAPGPRARASKQSGSMWGQDEVWKTMPIACRDWEKAMPDARWSAGVWWTKGGAQRQLQAWPLHRRDGRLSQVAEASNTRGEGVD